MKEVFVCEKPSVARDLAKTLSGGYKEIGGHYQGNDGRIYVSAFGHLVTCVKPEEMNSNWGWKGDISHLPFFIKDIPRKVIDDTGIKKQYKIIVDQMKQADVIVIATDAGREGEHIFRNIYKLAGINKPLKRLWVQDSTDSGILKAYENMKDGQDYEGLAEAGKLREESDLLIGLNATQLATKVTGNQKVLSLGRVQTPTLAMIVKRDLSIENFSKEVFYTVIAPIKDGKGAFELKLDKDERLDKNHANTILNMLGNRTGWKIDKEIKKEKPKELFDLTTLQEYMNKKHKWGAKKTLTVTQKLYESKFVTYPRTDSTYIASDENLPGILEKHQDNDLVNHILTEGYKIEKTFVNPSKVNDHEAITITTNANTKNLEGDQKLLYNEIFTRFIAAFYPYAFKEITTLSFNDGEYRFDTKDSRYIELGWRSLYDEEKKSEDTLSNVTLDDILDYELKEKATTPPKYYTEGSLINDMKNAGKFLLDKDERKMLSVVQGIGTVATRAEIIEKLYQREFIMNKNGKIMSTALGRELINMMPDDFSLYNVKLTAFFETLLASIEKGELSTEVFYEELEGMINKMAKEIRKNAKQLSSGKKEKEVIAKCPNCGRPMYENQKGYSCSGYKEGCSTTLWKNGLEKLGKKNISKTEAQKLLSGKKVNVALKSKAGNKYKKVVTFNTKTNWIEVVK